LASKKKTFKDFKKLIFKAFLTKNFFLNFCIFGLKKKKKKFLKKFIFSIIY